MLKGTELGIEKKKKLLHTNAQYQHQPSTILDDLDLNSITEG